MIRRMSAAAIGVAAALAVGGVALAAGADDPSPSPSSDDRVAVPMLPNGDPSPTATTGSPAPAPTVSARRITIDAAKAIAIGAAGGDRVTKVESRVEDGRAVWDIDVLVGGVRHDIHVDNATGAVLRNRAAVRVTVPSPATREAGDDHRGDRAREAGDDHGGHSGSGRSGSGGDHRGRGSDD